MNDIVEGYKKIAAQEAVKSVSSGMTVGLGSGSTARYALEFISELLSEGKLKNIVGIPTSVSTEILARQLGIPLSDLKNIVEIDITIDGADEVDENLNLIKGGGGALLREKVIAQLTKYEIIIVDDSKLSKLLGQNYPVPVEVIQFACESEKKYLHSLGGKPILRIEKSGEPFITDEGNFILDLFIDPLTSPLEFALKLNSRAGIVEHGLFINLTNEVIVAGKNGIQKLKK